jgi:hypothetical protein
MTACDVNHAEPADAEYRPVRPSDPSVVGTSMDEAPQHRAETSFCGRIEVRRDDAGDSAHLAQAPRVVTF